MHSLGREPQETRDQKKITAPEGRQIIVCGVNPPTAAMMWPRPRIAGNRPLAGDGALRRPKGVSNSPESDEHG